MEKKLDLVTHQREFVFSSDSSDDTADFLNHLKKSAILMDHLDNLLEVFSPFHSFAGKPFIGQRPFFLGPKTFVEHVESKRNSIFLLGNTCKEIIIPVVPIKEGEMIADQVKISVEHYNISKLKQGGPLVRVISGYSIYREFSDNSKFLKEKENSKKTHSVSL